MTGTASTATLSSLRASEIAEIRSLAVSIWREHYSSFLSNEQIEYMLQNKYTADDLLPYARGKEDRWFLLLRVGNVLAGFLRARLDNDCNSLKLEEIYLARRFRAQGYGSLLLSTAEKQAREHGRKLLYLYVNRSNASSIVVYQQKGFQIVKAIVFDIGHGFVMDDYRMEKTISCS